MDERRSRGVKWKIADFGLEIGRVTGQVEAWKSEEWGE
jgi:hypothetical protein